MADAAPTWNSLPAPSKKRAQREDVMAAIAAKGAAAAAAPLARGALAQQPPKAAQPKIVVRKENASNAGCIGRAGSADSKSKPNPKAKKRPDLRGEISCADGDNPKIVCLPCKDWKPYATWGRHCTTHHKENDSQDVDEIEVADNAEKGPLPKKKRNQREPR